MGVEFGVRNGELGEGWGDFFILLVFLVWFSMSRFYNFPCYSVILLLFYIFLSVFQIFILKIPTTFYILIAYYKKEGIPLKKKLTLLALLLVCATLLTGCFCDHQWQDATCKAPSTCSECGKTQGEIGTHKFLEATCTSPRTCQYCGLTEGSVADHTWVDATCTAPKTCSVCGETEGDPIDHPWADATTEAPKTCTLCGKTEGEPIKTDPRFKTASAAPLLGKWGVELVGDSVSLGLEGFPGEVTFTMTLDFHPDGTFNYGMELQDEEAFKESMVQYTLAQTYANMAQEGYSKEDADSAIWDNYGMPAEAYVRQTVGAMDFNELFSTVTSAMNIGGVYYVEAPFIYNSLTWDDEMDITMFGFDDEGGLYIYDYCVDLGLDARFTRIEEQAEAADDTTEESTPEETVEETTEETTEEATGETIEETGITT